MGNCCNNLFIATIECKTTPFNLEKQCLLSKRCFKAVNV